MIIVEPDQLTRWSLLTYLQQHCPAQAVGSAAEAETLLATQVASAVLISDQLTTAEAETLATQARRRNPTVRVIMMAAEDHETAGTTMQALRIEKPFVLEELARCLGMTGD